MIKVSVIFYSKKGSFVGIKIAYWFVKGHVILFFTYVKAHS